MYREILEEVVTVAVAVGVPMPADTVSQVMDVVPRLPGQWHSSLHYDLTHGKPMELETLHGTLVRLAQARNIAVPMCRALYGVLSPWAARNLDSK